MIYPCRRPIYRCIIGLVTIPVNQTTSGRRRVHVVKRVNFWRRADVGRIIVCSLVLRHKWRRADISIRRRTDVIYDDVGPMSKRLSVRRRLDVRNWRILLRVTDVGLTSVTDIGPMYHWKYVK